MRDIKKSTRLSALIVGLLASSTGHAADTISTMVPQAKPIESNGWAFSFSPYFWAAGLSGEFGQFNLPAVHLDQSFGDILNDLDFSTMMIGEARHGRYSFFADIQYTKVSSSAATPRGIVVNSVGLSSETFSGLFGAGYSVFRNDRATVDLVGGARVWHAGTEISLRGGLLGNVDATDSATWVDGMTGVRARYAITDEFYLSGWGLIGTGQAKLDWDVAAIVGYQINDTFSAVAGYRALGVDYSADGFTFDAVQQGPILGLVLHF